MEPSTRYQALSVLLPVSINIIRLNWVTWLVDTYFGKKVQWDNVHSGFALIERLENVTVLKKIYLIFLEFPYEGSEQEEH